MPGHWESLRAKNLFKKEQRPTLPGDEIVTCFRDGEVTLRKNRRTTGFTEATDYSNYQHICKGDLVIHQMDAFAGSSGVSDSDGMGTPVLSVCTPKTNKTDNHYYAHILRLMGWNGFILSLYRGIRERSSDFRFDTFSRQWLPVPPLSEQQAIVSYLDDKCGKIDQLLENKAKELELLAEMKQRVIADAVTKGLIHDVKFKTTNNICLPEVPMHWQIRRYGSLFKIKPVKQHHGEELLSVFLNLGVIRAAESDKRTHAASEDLSKYQLVEVGDFVMNNQQAWRGSVGVSQLVGIISPAYHIFPVPKCYDPVYANYLLRSKAIVGQFEMSSRGVGSIQRTLNFNWLNNKIVPVPPVDEQEKIVAHIEEKVSKIDALADKLQKEIESIKEYKQRLISDVVTGQINIL